MCSVGSNHCSATPIAALSICALNLPVPSWCTCHVQEISLHRRQRAFPFDAGGRERFLQGVDLLDIDIFFVSRIDIMELELLEVLNHALRNNIYRVIFTRNCQGIYSRKCNTLIGAPCEKEGGIRVD